MMLRNILSRLRSRVGRRGRQPQVRQYGQFQFRQVVERLEDRTLLSGQALSFDDVAVLMHQQSITGATVITHGYQISDSGGDSLISLAQAVRNRADLENGATQTAWLLDYDLPFGNVFQWQGTFDVNGLPSASGQTGEVVLLFDWAPESNEDSAGWGEAAGDALFSMLVGLGLANPAAGTAVPLHFIGHSFGAAVTSEAVERLAAFNVPVDQVTYLDPHDFDQGLTYDTAQRLSDLGQPTGYGASTWNNVRFTDAYYQTRTLNGSAVLDSLVPDGRPIPGAYNVWLDTELPSASPNPYGAFDVAGDHSYVWSGFYLATVTGSYSEDLNGNGTLDEEEDLNGDAKITVAPSPQTSFELSPSNVNAAGYALSRLGRKLTGRSLAELPNATFFGANQSHEHTPESFVNRTTGAANVAGLAAKGLTARGIVKCCG